MTASRQRMREDMQLRGLSPKTQEVYIQAVQQLARYYGKSPALIIEEELRQNFLYLITEKRVAPGTVNFLLSDIEGSTALWEQHPMAARKALIRHDALVEQIVAEHQGHVVRPRGEGARRFAVFARATDAVIAAATLQQALHAEPWPMPTPLRVRMAVHNGEADLRGGNYYGSAVDRRARLVRLIPICDTCFTKTP